MEKLKQLVNRYMSQHGQVQDPMHEIGFFGTHKLADIIKKAKGRRVEFFDDLEVQGWRDYIYSE